jgi:hypothetical protein
MKAAGGSKREGLWGGFEVVLPNGVVTRVAGGFTDKLKAEINLDPDSWIGRIFEMKGQPDPQTGDGLTKDGKVRFPAYIREFARAPTIQRFLHQHRNIWILRSLELYQVVISQYKFARLIYFIVA